MNKEKEIKEMAKVLYGHYCGKDECGKCKMPDCEEYRSAEWLVNAGYGKIARCKNLTENNMVDEFICSECGFQMENFCEKRVDEDDGDITYHEFEIRYCPNCGAKVENLL